MGIIEKLGNTIKGKRYKNALMNSLNVQFAPHSGTDRCSVYEGDNYIGTHNYIQNCMIGRGSYIGRDTTIQNAIIGRYTCIGAEVQMISGKHPSREYVSVHPAFYSLNPVAGKSYVSKQKFQETAYADEEGHQIIIGNDVWIGQRVTLMEGIKIGDGAIIAAGAVVTKDVPPYSIAGGVPAKETRKRFERDEIEWLLELQWWNKEEAWIKNHAEYFEHIALLRNKINE